MLKSIFNFRRETETRYQNIDAAQLYERLQSHEKLLVVDVRSPSEYANDGHIAGSRLLPLPTLSLRNNELPLNQPIVCVCRSGNRSRTACEQLAQFGFTNLYNLNGGMLGWQKAGLPFK